MTSGTHTGGGGDGRRAHLWVTGRVQGVFFRAHAAEKALSLGLAGWVRNLPDGRVEAVAEGAPEAVEEFIAWCRQGPPASRVDDVSVEWRQSAGDLGPFRVAY